jgi:hypothetical protein
MAVFGWLDIKQAELYTRTAERRRLARENIHLLGKGGIVKSFPPWGLGKVRWERKRQKTQQNQSQKSQAWCPRRDSNPHVLANIRF